MNCQVHYLNFWSSFRCVTSRSLRRVDTKLFPGWDTSHRTEIISSGPTKMIQSVQILKHSIIIYESYQLWTSGWGKITEKQSEESFAVTKKCENIISYMMDISFDLYFIAVMSFGNSMDKCTSFLLTKLYMLRWLWCHRSQVRSHSHSVRLEEFLFCFLW